MQHAAQLNLSQLQVRLAGTSRRARLWLTVAVAAALFIAPITFSSPAVAAGACGAPCDNISGDPATLAQQIASYFDSGNFVATAGTTYTNDIYYEEILPIAQGKAPKPNCAVDTRMLQLLVVILKKYGSLRISELNRLCPTIQSDVSCVGSASVHCTNPSQAVDFLSIGGTPVTGNDGTISFLQFLDTFMPYGTNALQSQCRSGVSFANLLGGTDTCGHQHVDLRNVSGQLAVSSEPIIGGGTLVQVIGIAGSGWQSFPTPVGVGNGQISTVNMGGNWPQIWVNEGCTLVEIWGDILGWHKVSTGINIGTGTISAVRVSNEANARIMVNENGTLMEVYGDRSGWHKGNTGMSIVESQISAVYMSGNWAQVMSNENGVLMQIYGNSRGWHKGNTGISIGKAYISAVNVGQAAPWVMANEDGTLMQISAYGGAWHKDSTGLNVGRGYISAVNMGPGWPQVMVNGGGTLLQAYGSSTGWHLASTGRPIGPGLVPAVNMRPGVTTNNWPSVITIQ